MSAGELVVRVGVDYLTASKVQDEHALETVTLIGKTFESTGELVTWQHGYEGVEVCGGNGQVMYRMCFDGLRGDVLTRLPGRALDWIRERNILTGGALSCTDADICQFFADNGFDATRVDVAMDTNDPAISPRIVENLVRAGHCTCRVKKAGNFSTWDINDSVNTAEDTFMLGRRSSSRYLRVYNKRLEHLASTGVDLGHLTRFELEHKAEAATRMLRLLAQYGAAAIPGIFAGWVNFKDPSDPNPRIDRKVNIDWWERLIGAAKPAVLGLSRGVTLPERSTKWLKHGVAKTLALAEDHGVMPEIYAAMDEKRRRVKPAEKKRWEHFKDCRKQALKGKAWNTGGATDTPPERTER